MQIANNTQRFKYPLEGEWKLETMNQKERLRAGWQMCALCLLLVAITIGSITSWQPPRVWVERPTINLGEVQVGQEGHVDFRILSDSKTATAISIATSGYTGAFVSFDKSTSVDSPAIVRVAWICRQTDLGPVSWRYTVVAGRRERPMELLLTATIVR